jgi:hypothetical protein
MSYINHLDDISHSHNKFCSSINYNNWGFDNLLFADTEFGKNKIQLIFAGNFTSNSA